MHFDPDFAVCFVLTMSTLAQERKVSFKAALSSSEESEDDLRPGQTTPSETDSVSVYRQCRQYKVYPWRWLLLVTLCLLNISNGMVTTPRRTKRPPYTNM